jgi:predicted nuclease with TOPRIM domain
MRVSLLILFFAASSLVALGQAADRSDGDTGPIKSSPAYAEVLLRKTELFAELESLAADYTDVNPKILDLRAELASLDRSLERIFGVRPSATNKLTAALGKLMVRKAELETDLARLMRSFNKDHPDTKRAKRRVEIFDNAINDILK